MKRKLLPYTTTIACQTDPNFGLDPNQANDPNFERQTLKVLRTMKNTYACYKESYWEEKASSSTIPTALH